MNVNKLPPEAPPVHLLTGPEDLKIWAESLLTYLASQQLDQYLNLIPAALTDRYGNSNGGSPSKTPSSPNKKIHRLNRARVINAIKDSIAPVLATLTAHGYDPAAREPRAHYDAVVAAMQTHAARSGAVRDLVFALCVVDADSENTLAAYQGRVHGLRGRMLAAGCYPGDAFFVWAAVLGLRLAYPGLYAELEERMRMGELSWEGWMARVSEKAIRETVTVGSPTKGVPVRVEKED